MKIDKISAIIKEVNKNAKDEIMSVGLQSYNYKRIPFTSPRMNYCSFGGLPIGKIIEFYGEEGGGKTTTTLDVISNYQNMEDAKAVLYVDAENRLDVEWAKKLDVDVDSLIILQPKGQSAEEIFDLIIRLVETDEIGLWVIDSLGVLLSDQEWEKEMDETTYGGISKPLTRFSKKIEALNIKHGCTGIGINQEREDLKSTWGGMKTPGGKAWKYVCSVRMRFSKGQFIDEKGNTLSRSADTPVGNIVQMSMTKNSTCPSTRRTGDYTINYFYGIDYLRDLIEIAILFNIIQKSGAWFDIVDTETGETLNDSKIQGQANVYEYLNDNEAVLARVEELVTTNIGSLA